MKKREIVLYGAGPFGRMVLADMRRSGTETAVAFTVDRPFLEENIIDGLPVVPYDRVKEIYPPSDYDMLVTCNYRHMRERAGLYRKAKEDGYHLINYVSASAIVDEPICMGDNNIILAGAVIGGCGCMGSDNIIRQNLYLGHNFMMGDHNILSVGCNIGGFCNIGSLCFFGLSVTIADRKNIGDECLLGMGSVVTKSIPAFATAYGCPAKVMSYHEETGVIIS